MAGYGTTARLLHWITVLLVLGMLPAGAIMVQQGLDRGLQDTLFIFHKNVGVIVLVLVLVRLAWRALNPPPALPDTVPALQRRVAGAVHGLLYAMLVFMAITGYVRVTAGGFPIEMLDRIGAPRLAPRSDALAEAAKTAHFYGRFVLVAAILAHIGGALHHGLIRRDGLFGRMWPPVAR